MYKVRDGSPKREARKLLAHVDIAARGRRGH